MKKLKLVIMIFLVSGLCSAAFSQTAPLDTEENKGDLQKNAATSEKDSTKTQIPPGYGDVKWGSDFETVKNGAKGKLSYVDENRIIISKEGEITYYYGFFFKDPEKVGEKEGEQRKAEYYYSSVEFPYSHLEMIKKKMIDKYGEPDRENVKNNRGAFLWESDTTIVIVWVDAYEGKPYVKKISYISKNVSDKIKQYFYEIFNQDKINVDKVLVP